MTPNGPEIQVFLGLGSNLGDRLANLRGAVELLGRRPGLRPVRSSRVYETDPVGPPQPDYLNAVIEVRASLPPLALLEACLGVEDLMGRVRTERWGPRVIDIDVLAYGREVIHEPGLVIPHPRMAERAFVLVPLLELEAEPVLPGDRSLRDLRIDPWGVRLFAPPLVHPVW